VYDRLDEDIPGREGIGMGSIVRARSKNDWIEQLVVQRLSPNTTQDNHPIEEEENSLMANGNRKEGKYKSGNVLILNARAGGGNMLMPRFGGLVGSGHTRVMITAMLQLVSTE
jgi:hypothetical protein